MTSVSPIQHAPPPPRKSGESVPRQWLTPRSPTPPDFQRLVTTNVRRHAGRATFRVAALMATDALVLWATTITLGALRRAVVDSDILGWAVQSVFNDRYLGVSHFVAALFIGLAVTGNYGAADRRRTPHTIVLGVGLAAALQLWSTVWQTAVYVSAVRYVGTVIVFGTALVLGRFALDQMLRAIYRRRSAARRTILVGKVADCEQMRMRSAFQGEDSLNVSVIVVTDDIAEGRPHAVHPLDELEFLIHEHRADTVVVCGYPGADVVCRAIKAGMASECHVMSWNPNFDVLGAQPELVLRDGNPFIEWRAPALRWYQLILKRLLDISVAAAALVALSPALAVIALLVRLDSPGPAVFGHARLGRFGRLFLCYKFRSMYPDAEQRLRADAELYAEYVRNDYKLPPERDARITRIGRFLRKTSLDELPQLWNVLKGDMSLVGARPIVPDELRHYNRESPLFLSLKPGMTGAWQVSGRSSVAYPERTQIELHYVQTWSLRRDISILLQTVPAVLVQRGAH